MEDLASKIMHDEYEIVLGRTLENRLTSIYNFSISSGIDLNKHLRSKRLYFLLTCPHIAPHQRFDGTIFWLVPTRENIRGISFKLTTILHLIQIRLQNSI